MTTATAPARMAKFDASTQHRRSMIAKVNIARQQLGMVEDDYRQILFDTTGEMSLKACDDRQLARMIDALKAKGFKPLPRPGDKAAQHPMAKKARALWISLYQLGVVHNPSEQALETFAKRQLKCERLNWARQSEGFRLIEALKAMGRRKGWQLETATGRHLGPIELKASLCQAILKRLKDLGVARMDWGLHDAAWKLCGIENKKDGSWSASDYEQLAAGLGEKLRQAPGFVAGEA